MDFISHVHRSFHSSSTRYVVFRNTTSQIAGRVMQAGASFLMTLLLARTYGAEGYGQFAKVIAYVPIFYLFSDFGLNAIYIREEEQHKKSGSPSVWQQLVDTRLYLSFVNIAIAIIIMNLLPKSAAGGFSGVARLGVFLYIPTILFQSLITSANAVFQFRRRYDYAAKAIAIGSILTVAGTVVTVMMVHEITGILWALGILAIGSAVTGISGIFFVARFQPVRFFATDIRSALSLLRTSLPLAMTLVFNLIYFRADILLMTFLRATSDVGIYAFAYRFFEFPLFIPTFFMNAVFPFMISTKHSLAEGDRLTYKRLISISSQVLILTSFVLLAVFWTVAPLLSMVKPEFASSVPVLRILSVSLPFFFLTSLTMWFLITERAYAVLASIYFVAMVTNILLNIRFIPQYGYIAAAWITIISEVLTLVLSLLASYRYAKANDIV